MTEMGFRTLWHALRLCAGIDRVKLSMQVFRWGGEHARFRAASVDFARWLELVDTGLAVNAAAALVIRGCGAVCPGGYRFIAGTTDLGMVAVVS